MEQMQQKMRVLRAVTYQPSCYGELLAYQLAFNETMRLNETLPLLNEEESPLVPKLIEAAGEVCALLAQAWEVRQYKVQYVESLQAAEGVAAKVQTWVAFAVECGYLSVEDGEIHRDLYDDVLKEIRALIKTADIVVRLVA